ncbi:hypothetical protein L2E82_06357 [Cichorium intybus]|uniref:Uncharacterized protein n=1 Tax=Cichorium intybus TaxID=13427 RepID=A0ACB9HC12_CICIN|nr:hypothetical protein L2E82_06357 [Cichorium intybus]
MVEKLQQSAINQSEHDELQAKFFEERAALETKYQKLYAPLYSKMIKLKKDLPSFLLNAMRTNEILAEEREMKKLSNI